MVNLRKKTIKIINEIIEDPINLTDHWRKSLWISLQMDLKRLKDRAHLSTFEFFILEKFSCIVVLIVFFVIVQSSGLISV